jgi:pilus assembly protein CpaC
MRKHSNLASTIAAKGKTMNRRLITTLLTAACAAAPMALIPAQAAHAQSVMRPGNDLVLSIGRGQLITVPGKMADVFVANEQIADVQIKSTNQLYVFGKAGGETTVYASNAAGDVIWSANIRVGSNIDSVDQMLHLAMPDAKITVSTMGTNTLLLTGTVAAPEDAAEAQRLVAAFVGTGANVITRLKMATPLQVNLQVKFAEVSRSLVRSIGANLNSFDSSGGFKFAIGQGRASVPQFVPGGPVASGTGASAGVSVVVPQATGSTLGMFGKFLGLDLAGTLDLAERDGLLTTLSQPNLTALSGETADFLAGGEYPIPTSQGLGTTSIEYKKFGVSLSYTPTVLANGRISLRVRPEVSELSSDGAVTLNGFQVPALTIRRAETTIELGSGQSFMIAGLMSNNYQNTIDKTPGAGDVPILGNLFRSTQFRKGQTELVIVVTPYLVNPVDANDIKLPTDGLTIPNEAQRLLGNMNVGSKSAIDRPKPTTAPDAAPGPKVGALDEPAAPATAQPASSAPRTAIATEVPTPGFNLN